MVIKAILSDCWGTLFYDDVDPRPLPEIARVLGYSHNDYSYIKVFERNFMLYPLEDVDEAIRNFLEELGKMSDKLFFRIKQLYTNIGVHAKPFDDVPPVLKQLKKEGYKLCIVSNTCSVGFGELKKRWKNVLDLFDACVLSYEVHELKPSPVMFNTALEKLKVEPSQAVMVGDSLKDDVLAAEACGIKGLLLDRRNKHPDYPKRMESLHEIWKFLGKEAPR